MALKLEFMQQPLEQPREPKSVQLDFFDGEHQLMLNFRMDRIEEKQEKQRKAQFGQIGTLKKRMDELERKYEYIERGLCLNQGL